MLNQFFIIETLEILNPHIHCDGDRRNHHEKRQGQRRSDHLKTEAPGKEGARQCGRENAGMENAERCVQNRAILLGERNEIGGGHAAPCKDAQAPTFRRHYVDEEQTDPPRDGEAVRQLPNWSFEMNKRRPRVLRRPVDGPVNDQGVQFRQLQKKVGAHSDGKRRDQQAKNKAAMKDRLDLKKAVRLPSRLSDNSAPLACSGAVKIWIKYLNRPRPIQTGAALS